MGSDAAVQHGEGGVRRGCRYAVAAVAGGVGGEEIDVRPGYGLLTAVNDTVDGDR